MIPAPVQRFMIPKFLKQRFMILTCFVTMVHDSRFRFHPRNWSVCRGVFLRVYWAAVISWRLCARANNCNKDRSRKISAFITQAYGYGNRSVQRRFVNPNPIQGLRKRKLIPFLRPKAEKWHPFKEKTKLSLAWKGKLYFFSVTLDV